MNQEKVIKIRVSTRYNDHYITITEEGLKLAEDPMRPIKKTIKELWKKEYKEEIKNI